MKDKPDALEADATAANEALSAALGRVLEDTDELKRQVAAGADVGDLAGIVDRISGTVQGIKAAADAADPVPDFPTPEGQ